MSKPMKIVTMSNVPNGSGLGTSSILMLGVLRAVLKVHGFSLTLNEESDLVLASEQVLGSGGVARSNGGGNTWCKTYMRKFRGNLEVFPTTISSKI